MSNSRIHRYITKEITGPVFLSLFIFTFVLLMGRIPGLTELVINKDVPAVEVLQLFSYMLPTFIRITLPLSFLLSILLAFTRLSTDCEFIALKASGISLYTLLKPVLLLAVLFSLLTASLTILLEPAGKAAFNSKLFEIASSKASIGIRPNIFNEDFEGLTIHARAMEERQGIMRGVFISDERNGEIPSTIFAEQGRFIPDPENFRMTLRLNHGSIHRRPIDKDKSTYQVIRFDTYDFNLNMGQPLGERRQRGLSRGELSWQELDQAYAGSTNDHERFRFQSEKHMRITIAFAPLFFSLIGVPLGLQSNRSGKGAGFSLALGISLAYYLLFSAASTLAGKGMLPVSVALWIPNFCFLIIGSYFIHRTAIEQPVRLMEAPKRYLSLLLRHRKGV